MTTMEINVDNIEEELIEIKKEYTKLDEKHSKVLFIYIKEISKMYIKRILQNKNILNLLYLII